MGPLLLGYSLVYINQMVDKMLVSGLEAGAVTSLNYAAVLSNLVSTFITTFASMLFAYVTTRIAVGDADGAAQLTERTALLLSVIFLPITILTVLLSEEIVTIVYARGAFDAESVRICAQALRGYALMFVPLVFREVYSRFQYGHQDSKRPMVNSSIGIALNIVLSVALCPRYGVLGVAFATSMSVSCGRYSCGMRRAEYVLCQKAEHRLVFSSLPALAAFFSPVRSGLRRNCSLQCHAFSRTECAAPLCPLCTYRHGGLCCVCQPIAPASVAAASAE